MRRTTPKFHIPLHGLVQGTTACYNSTQYRYSSYFKCDRIAVLNRFCDARFVYFMLKARRLSSSLDNIWQVLDKYYGMKPTVREEAQLCIR
jgi:hypothetical protein